MIGDFRKPQRVHPPIYIDGTTVEKVENFKFLGIHNHWQTEMDHPHRQCGEEDATELLQHQEAN
jgi:hypothetical protein